MAKEIDIHAKLRAFAQELWDSDHICLKDANFNWLDARTASETKMIVTEVEIRTMTVEAKD